MDGRGVAQDEEQAVAWWCQAAELGNELAKFNLDALHVLQRGDSTEAVEWLRRAGEQSDNDAKGILMFGERLPAVGGIESLVLDGTTYFFGFDYRSDLVLSRLFDDIDAMAFYASLNMLQSDGKHDVAYWRTLANEAVDASELSPGLESQTFSSQALGLTRLNLQRACQNNSTVPGFSISYHLLYLLESAGGWEADMGDIQTEIRIIAGDRPLKEGESVSKVAQDVQARLKELLRCAPGNWRELFAVLSPE